MKNKLLEIINTVLENANRETINSIDNNTRLREDLGFDSFNLAELTVRIENVFDVDIFENGLINTIEEIVRILDEKK